MQELKHGQRYNIYKELRRHGIKPSQIRIEGKSKDTLENAVYSLRLIKEKGGKDVGIVSYPGHLDRFEEIIKYGKKEGLIDHKFKIHRIEIEETHKERLYEVLARILNKYKLRHGLKEGLKPDPIAMKAKKMGNYFMNLFSSNKEKK